MSQQAPRTGVPVMILKEGSQRTTGVDARRSNIQAAKVIAEILSTSLGPRGMDKMLIDAFGDVTITGDGATILKEMEVQHPAAKLLIEVAKAQDAEVGDGTTTVVVLAGKLLELGEELLEEGIHPTIVIDGYKKAADYALKVAEEIAKPIELTKEQLLRVVSSALSSKVVAETRDYLAGLVVEAALQAVEMRDGKPYLDLDWIKIEKKKGKSIYETQLVRGIVLDKEVVHPGMPKRVTNAKIAVLDAPLEIEKPEWTTKISVTSPEQIKAFLDQEAEILKSYVDHLASIGANVVITQKGIDEVAQHFLAKKGILAVRRVKRSDIEKLARATGAKIITSIKDAKPEDLGTAGLVEERKVGEEKMVFVEEIPNPRAVTILVRGGSDRILDEVERSLQDALHVSRDLFREPKIVPGGGAFEVEVARRVREFARKLPGKEQLAALKFADALEHIPTILALTAGLDPVDAIAELRRRHDNGEITAGVDVHGGKIADMAALNVWDPLLVKKQVIKSAVEAAIMILRIDDIIAAGAPKREEKGKKKEGEEGEEKKEETKFD
ncbi:thermosome subunit alpha [Pyrobaculum aerophilum]|uniref:Thermosome subunit beta n=2 Tax=Pyrobaculum aerophilum TaxID=13773 RepID=Q8ZTF8_PYRAE|nr:thermosome subunit alpha [Pyrobaculum aerophilum]AAL64803.1 thermosome (chaperonin) beta subunit [Pyrobaculum aerophilum str. IM2]MCX8136315.1 thermosome subunit alpha [Pyrobaculum aerophilum]HII47586.1 thermosome subunit [Pyrobaculum aerophilum]